MLNQGEITDRVEEDLQILGVMSEIILVYLNSTAVYYPLPDASYPRLTIGNYLMRQQRLLALRPNLHREDKARLDTAVSQFQQAIHECIVQIEQKGLEEGHIRLRQWGQAVSNLIETPDDTIPYYATVVENRVMLAALLNHLQHEPYRLDKGLWAYTAVVDKKLHAIWQTGDFVWSDVWRPAYAEKDYWWLYGQPLSRSPL